MAMLALGLFVFSMETLPYQDFKQRIAWRHPGSSRVGARPSHQYIGPDDETIDLSGVLLPEITGGRLTLELVRAMGDTGKAWPLIEGTGAILGLYVINALDITRTLFFDDGAARRYDFTLQLTRVDDDQRDLLASLDGIMRQFF